MRRYPDVFLMRHGQTEWNAAGRMQGWLDSPLTALGRTQAARQATIIGPLLPGLARYSSTLGRAEATARIVFGGDDFTRDARLAEIDIGHFSGAMIEDLRPGYPEVFTGGRLDWYDRAPGGEHFVGLETRARAFLDALTGPAIIVTHGITLRMLRRLILGWPIERLADLTVEQGAVHAIRNGRHEVLR